MKKFLVCMSAALMLIGVTVLGAREVRAEDELIVGYSTDLTGSTANIGQGCANAAQLYVDKINAAGGLNGQKVKLIIYDSKLIPEEAAKIANKMIDDGVEVAILDYMKSLVHPAAQVLSKHNILMFGTSGSATLLDLDLFPNMWRPCASLEFMLPSMLETLKRLDIKTLAWFSSQVESNLALHDEMAPLLEEVGIELVCSEYTPGGDTDYSGQISRIIDADPDGVFYAISGMEQAAFVKQLRQFGYEKLVFDFESVALDIAQAAGDAINNVIYCYPYVVNETIDSYTDPYMISFLEEYQDAYGELPKNYGTYIGWDCMVVLEEAARIAGSNDVDALMAAMDQIKDLKGIGGTFDFTAGDHECLHSFPAYIMVNQAAYPLDNWLEEGGYEALLEEIG